MRILIYILADDLENLVKYVWETRINSWNYFCSDGLELVVSSDKNTLGGHGKMEDKNGGQPSKSYINIMRLLGIVFALAGGYLIKLAVK